VYVVILPLTLLEACVFCFCKVEAEERVIYQEFARVEWAKGEENPAEQRRNTLDKFENI